VAFGSYAFSEDGQRPSNQIRGRELERATQARETDRAVEHELERQEWVEGIALLARALGLGRNHEGHEQRRCSSSKTGGEWTRHTHVSVGERWWRQQQRTRQERDEVEDAAPADVFDQRAADHWADDGSRQGRQHHECHGIATRLPRVDVGHRAHTDDSQTRNCRSIKPSR